MSITWEEIDQKYVEYRDRSVEGGSIRSESDLPPLQTGSSCATYQSYLSEGISTKPVLEVYRMN